MKNLITQMFDPESKFLTGSWLFMLVLMAMMLLFPELSLVYGTLFFVNLVLNGIVSIYHFIIGSKKLIDWLSIQMEEAKKLQKS